MSGRSRLGRSGVCGLFEGHALVVCETQWGMANASALAALAIARYRPQAIISQGTAGAHDASLAVYDIVLGARTANFSAWQSHYRAAGTGVDYRGLKQLGVFAWDKARGKFTQEVYHEGNPALLAAARRAAARYEHGKVVEGTITTCDSWNCEVDRIAFLHEFYGSLAEEMEGDAVAQVCQSFDVPFLDVRIISNSILLNQDPWDLGTCLSRVCTCVAARILAGRVLKEIKPKEAAAKIQSYLGCSLFSALVARLTCCVLSSVQAVSAGMYSCK